MKMACDGMSLIKGEDKLPPLPLFTESLKLLAQTKANDEAFVFVSTNCERDVITWKELYECSIKVANALKDSGVRKGKIVAICLRQCPEWLYMMLGAMLIGALPVSMVFTYKDGSDVIKFMERLVKCSFIAIDPGYDNENLTILKSLVDHITADGKVKSKKMPFLRYVVAHHPDVEVEGFKQLTEWYNEQHAEASLPQINPDDTAFLFQSSGSTGVPKIIAHSFKTLSYWNQQWEVMESSRYFNDRPFSWSGGFPFTIASGVTRVTVSGFSPPPSDRTGFIIGVIKRERCDTALILPPMLAELTLRQEKSDDYKPLLRAVYTGGQPISGSVQRCVGVVCEKLFIGYGTTESGLASVHLHHIEDSYKESLCGKPYPGVEVKIVDEEGDILSVNKSGEIYLRTLLMMKEIFGDPGRTEKAFTKDGWLRTGDIGRIDVDGQLFVEGRKSNEIIRGGMNITAEYLEAVLRRCPDIKDAIVIPVPHPTLYQEICACTILKRDSLTREADIRKFCEDMYADKQRVFTYLPDHYMILDRFPETSTGKPSRSLLKDKAKCMFEQK